MNDTEQNKTITATFLNEGKSTLGLWLPFALSDLYILLMCNIRMQSSKPEQIKIPKRHEILAGWCLPMLSKSLEADEKEREALELFRSVEKLNERYGK